MAEVAEIIAAAAVVRSSRDSSSSEPAEVAIATEALLDAPCSFISSGVDGEPV